MAEKLNRVASLLIMSPGPSYPLFADSFATRCEELPAARPGENRNGWSVPENVNSGWFVFPEQLYESALFATTLKLVIRTVAKVRGEAL